MISQTTIYFILKKHRGGFLSIPSLDCATLLYRQYSILISPFMLHTFQTNIYCEKQKFHVVYANNCHFSVCINIRW